MSSLSESDKISTFQSITQLSEDQCRSILQRHDWNLEMAVQAVFNVPSAAGPDEGLRQRRTARDSVQNAPATSTASSSSSSSSSTASASFEQRYRPTDDANQRGLLQYILDLIFLPFRATGSLLQVVAAFIGTLMPGFDVSAMLGGASADAIPDMASHLRRTYPDLRLPSFSSQPLSQAISSARTSAKFVFVYVHDENSEDSDRLCRETLSSPDLVNFINEQFMPVAYDTRSQTGRQALRMFRLNRSPATAIVAPADDSRLIAAGMHVGFVSAEELFQECLTTVERLQPSMSQQREAVAERQASQSIREEQDEAYLKALRQDQMREEARKKEEEERRQQEEAARLAQEQQEREQQERQRLLERKRQELPAEPSEGEPRVVVAVQLPSGRVTRAFPLNATLDKLYDFVDVQEDVSANFTLFTAHPKTEVPCDAQATFKEAGFGKRALLFCEDNEA